MNEHLKRIMDDNMAILTDAKKKADDALAKAKRDMGTLVEFAETLPQRMLDKMSHVFVGQLDFSNGEYFRQEEAYVQIGGRQEQFIPYNSGKKLDPMKGKYRVIVVLQKTE